MSVCIFQLKMGVDLMFNNKGRIMTETLDVALYFFHLLPGSGIGVDIIPKVEVDRTHENACSVIIG